MAVAYVASAYGTLSSSSAWAVVNLSGQSAGELAFVLISRNSDAAPTTVPTGWILLQSHISTYGVWLYRKVLTEDDLATATWYWGAAAKTIATFTTYADFDSESPVPVSGKGAFVADSGTSVDCGSISTSAPMVAVFGSCYATSSRTYNALSGYSERLDVGSSNPDHWHLIADTNGGHGGGTIAPDFTVSGDSTYRGGFIVAIAAAGALPAARIFVPDLQGGLDCNLTGGI